MFCLVKMGNVTVAVTGKHTYLSGFVIKKTTT